MRYVETPEKKITQYIVRKFMTKGTALDCKKGKAAEPITTTSPAKLNGVRGVVQQSPKKSLRRRSQQLGISVTSLQRMLRKDLNKFRTKYLHATSSQTQTSRNVLKCATE